MLENIYPELVPVFCYFMYTYYVYRNTVILCISMYDLSSNIRDVISVLVTFVVVVGGGGGVVVVYLVFTEAQDI